MLASKLVSVVGLLTLVVGTSSPVAADAVWRTDAGEQLIVIEAGDGTACGLWLEPGMGRGTLLTGTAGSGRIALVSQSGRLAIAATYTDQSLTARMRGGMPGAPARAFGARAVLSSAGLVSNGLWAGSDGVARLVFVGRSLGGGLQSMVAELAERDGDVLMSELYLGGATVDSRMAGRLQAMSLGSPVGLQFSWVGEVALGVEMTPFGPQRFRAVRVD